MFPIMASYDPSKFIIHNNAKSIDWEQNGYVKGPYNVQRVFQEVMLYNLTKYLYILLLISIFNVYHTISKNTLLGYFINKIPHEVIIMMWVKEVWEPHGRDWLGV